MTEADEYFTLNLKAAREARGWTQSQLAEALVERGIVINQTAISRIEKGDREVRLAEARALAAIFNTTVDALSGSPEKFSSVIEWNRLTGNLKDSERDLRSAAFRYEQARLALRNYLEVSRDPLILWLSTQRENDWVVKAAKFFNAKAIVEDVVKRFEEELSRAADASEEAPD